MHLYDRAADLRVNFLYYEQIDAKGKISRISRITSLSLNRRNVEKIMRAARARWKIEHETFGKFIPNSTRMIFILEIAGEQQVLKCNILTDNQAQAQ